LPARIVVKTHGASVLSQPSHVVTRPLHVVAIDTAFNRSRSCTALQEIVSNDI